MNNTRVTIPQIIDKKAKGEKIVMLTAYDYPFASLVDESGVDIILVGDSLANVVLGLKSTTEVSMEEMLSHAAAVNRGVKHALVVGDMPYESYQKEPSKCVENARRFIDEAGCGAVKLEWFDQCLEVTEQIIAVGIPVMNHIGLTPQTAEKLGGFKVQGKNAASAQELIHRALALQEKGCFSLVLECMPLELARIITEKLTIPTISCGAGYYCDGQVLVLNDLLGLASQFRPKFVKQYCDIKPTVLEAVKAYCQDVRTGKFPEDAHCYLMDKSEFEKIS